MDWLLSRKAKEGVQIYVILWDETKIAVFKGSKRAQEMLETHPNVYMLNIPRIPTHLPLPFTSFLSFTYLNLNRYMLSGILHLHLYTGVTIRFVSDLLKRL